AQQQATWWLSKGAITIRLYFKCPCCRGSQYRTSQFDVTVNNPHGAKCIFCKSVMTAQMS
uniref:cold shock small protein YmcF n=1 Tax=Proteus terrae TaxID=1574161 RepID=UPI00374326BA